MRPVLSKPLTKARWMPKMCTAPQREHDFDVVTEKGTHEKTHGASTGARFASFRAKMVRKWRLLTPIASSYNELLRQDKKCRSDCKTPLKSGCNNKQCGLGGRAGTEARAQFLCRISTASRRERADVLDHQQQ